MLYTQLNSVAKIANSQFAFISTIIFFSSYQHRFAYEFRKYSYDNRTIKWHDDEKRCDYWIFSWFLSRERGRALFGELHVIFLGVLGEFFDGLLTRKCGRSFWQCPQHFLKWILPFLSSFWGKFHLSSALWSKFYPSQQFLTWILSSKRFFKEILMFSAKFGVNFNV